MGIYEENLAVLKQRYAYVEEKIRNININEIENKVYIKESANGDIILCMNYNGRQWRLGSIWNPDIASQAYAERYQIKLYGIYFVFGFSDGRCIRELLKKCDDTNLLVICEPNMKIFAAACHYFDLKDLINDNRILIYFEELEQDADGMMHQLVDYTKIKLLDFCILPAYDLLYHDACEKYMESVLESMRSEIVNKATHLTFDRSVPQHLLFHIRNLLTHRNLEQVKFALKGLDLEDIPVIIVSAGPSLDKNIHLLKKVQGKAFIIAVDASIRSVIHSGVRPDLLCSIDPNSPERFFNDLDLEDIFWACDQLSNPTLLKKYAKNIIYYGSYGKKYNSLLKKELGYKFPTIVSGGSVSTEAMMLALYLGFRKIILIGQDLAFTGGVSHTKGVEGALGDNDEYIQSRHRVEVEGIDGTTLETDFQMWYYKQWFERVIRINKDAIRVIDATEGGARIEGTEIRNFAEVIENECKKDFDMHGILESIPQMFSVEQRQKILLELRELKNQIIRFKENLDSVILEQEKMIQEIERENVSPNEITLILKRIAEQNDIIHRDDVFEYVSMYAQKEEYEMGDSIYTEEKIEPKELIEKSLLLLRGYQRGMDLYEEDYEEYIMKK